MANVNKNVFTGADGSLTLSPSKGPEGDTAKGILSTYDTLTVGRVQNVTVEVSTDVKPFHEIGQRYATELRAGNVSVKGTIGRAYINGAMLNLLVGDAASKSPGGNVIQPTFNISLQVANTATPTVRSTITLHDVKIDNWSYNLPEDDFVMEAISFQALFVSIEDKA